MGKQTLPDRDVRDRLIASRRNVFIDAGAGTGKTYTIVERLLELVAPQESESPPLEMDKVAAITFTRRAAGELKTRLRSHCLDKLREAIQDGNKLRRDRLKTVLERLSSAFVGTIHSFADRLLSQRPVESRLSPSYRIAEDTEQLVERTYGALMGGIRRGALEDEFGDPPEDLDLGQIGDTVQLLLDAGVPEEDRGEGYRRRFGLESLVGCWISSRELSAPTIPGSVEVSGIHRALEEGLEQLTRLPAEADQPDGVQFLTREVLPAFKRALREDSPRELFRILNRVYAKPPLAKSGRYGNLSAGDFAHDRAKGLQASLSETSDGRILKTNDYCSVDPTYRERIIQPLRRWMSHQLIPVRRAVIELYEQVKQEQGVVDQTDLLIKLRDLLRDDKKVRRELQDRYEHILVDEFQDTDPLQCEIAFFLSEDPESSPADSWTNVDLEEGALTVVGDPKQSIYRFRRADIQTFAGAATRLRDQGALVGTLRTNFRSLPGLIEVYNRCFGDFLGRPDEAHSIAYNHTTGEALYEDVYPCPWFQRREESEPLQLLRYNARKRRKDDSIEQEARMVADYVDWLTDGEGDPRKRIRDPSSPLEEPDLRACRLSDIAILGRSTRYFDVYLRAFSRRGIPCTVAGGSTFMDDDAVKQFILALRAVADPSDGVAQAALRRPPFFAIDYADLLSERIKDAGDDFADREGRRHEMETTIERLRTGRRNRPPLETALDLIDRTLCSKYYASRPSGPLTLVSLYHVAAWLDRIARRRGLDYDAATSQLREWLTEPPDINAPAPLDEDALRLMTTYQAKGLEYPVVILFDGRSTVKRPGRMAYKQNPSGERCFFDLSGFKTEIDPETGESLKDREKKMIRAESKRVFYVAATRARDRLIVPWPYNLGRGTPVYQKIFSPAEDRAHTFDLDDPDDPYPWRDGKTGEGESGEVRVEFSRRRQNQLEQEMTGARSQIREAVRRGEGVTSPHKEMSAKYGGGAQDFQNARHGRNFGQAVHRALELILDDDPKTADTTSYVRRALAEQPDGIDPREQVHADVEHALDTLREEGFLDEGERRTEYPFSYRHEGNIVSGVMDLVVIRGDAVRVVDFKTDSAPQSIEKAREPFDRYFYQLSFYRRAIESDLDPADLRTALLFTETGLLVPTPED